MAEKKISAGKLVMVVQYQWIVENIEEEAKTISSKMIMFRGAKVFRIGLKNRAPSENGNPVLFFMTIDANKIGLKVKEVVYYAMQDADRCRTMTQMKKELIGGDGNLQLFTYDLSQMVVGSATFTFRIYVQGNLTDFSYQLTDQLVKNQLWDASETCQHWVDVECVVKDKKFGVHKAILAARSRVFAAELMKERPERDGLLKIQIDGVDPSSIEQFLHFVYTGEVMSTSTLVNEELLKLADRFKVTTLASMCRKAQKTTDALQMTNVVSTLHKESKSAVPYEIRYT